MSKSKYFEQAFLKLKAFVEHFDGTEVQRAGIIQAFEFTYEQAWKSVQKLAQEEGVVVASPKKAFQWAMSAGLIAVTSEQVWLSMIDERNQTSHTYRDAVAQKVLTNIQTHYLSAFENLLKKL